MMYTCCAKPIGGLEVEHIHRHIALLEAFLGAVQYINFRNH